MEQLTITQTFRENNSYFAAKLLTVMMIITLLTFMLSIFPVSVTIMFLIAPALIMNLGWLVFSAAV